MQQKGVGQSKERKGAVIGQLWGTDRQGSCCQDVWQAPYNLIKEPH